MSRLHASCRAPRVGVPGALLARLGRNYVIQFAPDGKCVSTLIIASDGTKGSSEPKPRSLFEGAAAESTEAPQERSLSEDPLEAEESVPPEASPTAVARPVAHPSSFPPAGPVAAPPDPPPGPAGPSLNGAAPLLPSGMRRHTPAAVPPSPQ